MTTTIKNISEYKNYKDYICGMSEDDMDATPYEYMDKTELFDLKKIRIKYNFHPRSKVMVITQLWDGKDRANNIPPPLNKDNMFYDTLCQCPKDVEGAVPTYLPWIYGVPYPFGNVVIFGETKDELIERQNKMNEEKRMKKVRKEFMKKLEKCDEKMMCMLIDRLEELEEENNK